MRWDHLLADLEAQGHAADDAALDTEVADRTRLERGRLGVADRLRAQRDAQVRLQVRGAGQLTGTVRDVGPDWVLLADPHVPDRETVVALGALDVLTLPSDASAPDGSGRTARSQDLAWVLGRLARDRAGVRILLREGAAVGGTVDRVGTDHVDVALHDGDVLRRGDQVRGRAVVSLAAIAAVVRL
jgi:hypothetical protein